MSPNQTPEATLGNPEGRILYAAFEEDHRKLTQGLNRVLRLVRSGDLVTAAEQADKLDLAAGPHIEFEEKIFYPTLRKKMGGKFVGHLFEEHRVGKEALTVLRNLSTNERLDGLPIEDLGTLAGKLNVALEHAYSCGSLLSHLDSLDVAELKKMIESLMEMRHRAHRWTDLPDPPHATAPVS